MYCRKCGKQIDYDAPICKECEETEIYFGNPETDTQPIAETKFEEKPAPQGSRKEGFGGALTATILGSISFIISIIAMSLASVAIELSLYYDVTGLVIFTIVFTVISLGCAIPSMILGIKGIRCFIKAKNQGKIKPVATLVLGIVGLVSSAMTILYALLTLLMCLII